jgi:hypothetical protein
LETPGVGARDPLNSLAMRSFFFALIFVLSPMTSFASQSALPGALPAQDLARVLITGPNQINEYSGVTPKYVSCQASLSVREGRLEGFLTWGDTGVAVKADLNAPVEIVSQKDGVTALRVSQFDEPSMTMTLKVKNDKVTTITIQGNDPIWFIPRHFKEVCDQLQQFIPMKR